MVRRMQGAPCWRWVYRQGVTTELANNVVSIEESSDRIDEGHERVEGRESVYFDVVVIVRRLLELGISGEGCLDVTPVFHASGDLAGEIDIDELGIVDAEPELGSCGRRAAFLMRGCGMMINSRSCAKCVGSNAPRLPTHGS
jgi:hypothetical protein